MVTSVRQLASVLLVTFAGSLAVGCAAPDDESDDEASEASEVDNVEQAAVVYWMKTDRPLMFRASCLQLAALYKKNGNWRGVPVVDAKCVHEKKDRDNLSFRLWLRLRD